MLIDHEKFQLSKCILCQGPFFYYHSHSQYQPIFIAKVHPGTIRVVFKSLNKLVPMNKKTPIAKMQS